MNEKEYKYDLLERVTKFGKDIVVFCRSIKQDNINKPIINQLVRSGTSIGANYCEANNASSKKDFKNKIFICKKEAQETKYWLTLIEKSNPEKKKEIEILKKECQEFLMIFQKIINICNNKKGN
jgi:four helix bundle protein